MGLMNESDFENNTFTFFGPMEMAYQEDGKALEETDMVKLFLSIFWGVIMIVSVIGNVSTCAVVIRDRTMRTPTNIYLLNLAVTDLLTVLFIPIEIYFLWVPEFYPFGEDGCRFHFALMECISNCSVLTISAFTVERYLVIIRPFYRQKLSSNTRVVKIIVLNWMIACGFCIPDLFYVDLIERKKYVFCYITISEQLEILMVLELFVFFAMPMAIITIIYVLIALKLKSVNLEMRNSPVNGTQNRDKAVKMLAAVAGMFFFCWSPFCIYRIMMILPTYKYNLLVWRILNYLCGINIYISAAVNPILYSLMSRKFRQAFKDLLKGRMRTRIESTTTISRVQTPTTSSSKYMKSYY